MEPWQLAALFVIFNRLTRVERRQQRRLWRQPYFARRESLWNNVVPIYSEYNEEDPARFARKFRMLKESFEHLLATVTGSIQRQDTHLRRAIPPRLRLQIYIRYIVSGADFGTLEDIFRVPNQTTTTTVAPVTQAPGNLSYYD